MFDEGSGAGHLRGIPHYHGDAVRALFMLGAIVLIVAESIGVNLPLSVTGVVVAAALLVIAAGITNPTAQWIHWLNALLAITGTLLFGTSVIEQYRAGANTMSLSFVFLEALALVSLFALYFTTRTIRGLWLRPENQ